MKKAILKNGFVLLEVYGGMDIDDYENEDFIVFEKGMKVNVLMEFTDRDDEEQCVIFSEDIEESTTVSKLLLDFVV